MLPRIMALFLNHVSVSRDRDGVTIHDLFSGMYVYN
jgi:hypothetical protein